MSYWREGDKKQFLFVVLLSMILVSSTITLSTFTSTCTNDYNIYEKSTVPNSNDTLVNTTLELLVNSIIIQDGNTINSQFNEVLNVTVFYRDNITDSHLTGADVDLLGLGSFDEIGTQYNFSLQTNNLTKGINILTIFAQLDGYEAQTIHFFLNVDERATELILFVNGVPINQNDIIQFKVNELINITVFYKDYLTGTHLSGANVELLGYNTLDELNSQFNITINTNVLTQGINILTIFAQLDGYEAQTILFFIEVVERATRIQLFLNGVDKTYDPVLELPIGSLINITVKFYDNQTGLEIPSALVQLIGESQSENLTENVIFKQYSIILNSSNLSIGVRLFTIIAQAPTYQINTIDIRITVNRIATNISGNSLIEILAGETIHIEVELTDLDFGGSIIGAIVTYTWQFSQGELTDLNSDGIYEVNLTSTKVGTYNLVINAYKGENYDFQSFQITIMIANTFEVFILSSDASNPDSDGTFYLFWISSEHADNYSIYVYHSVITQINSSVILIGAQTDNSPYLISGLPNGIYNYVVIAFNEYGNASSNCVQVIVSRVVDEDIIPGYDLLTFICMISVLSIIIVQKLREKI